MPIIKIIVTGFYLGLVPKASGTVGTLLGIPLVILLSQLGDLAYLGCTLILIVASGILIDIYENNLETNDHSSVVIDEIVGFLVAMSLLPPNLIYIVLAFVIFRILDIFKPFPISYVEKSIKGGMGVVLDDVVAGAITNLLLHIALAPVFG